VLDRMRRSETTSRGRSSDHEPRVFYHLIGPWSCFRRVCGRMSSRSFVLASCPLFRPLGLLGDRCCGKIQRWLRVTFCGPFVSGAGALYLFSDAAPITQDGISNRTWSSAYRCDFLEPRSLLFFTRCDSETTSARLDSGCCRVSRAELYRGPPA
jgi:hypothetical protein